MADAAAPQWTVMVKIEELDRGDFQVKNRWLPGESISVQIEGHGTVSMLKQRVAMIIAAHEKWQTMKVGDVELTDPSARLDSIEGLGDGGTVSVFAKAPMAAEEDLGELSDDSDAMVEETEAPPGLPEGEAFDKELTEEQEDKQNAFKGVAAELMEDGDKAGALGKLTEAIMVGNPNAMLLSKRGELLLKMKRPNAALLDGNAALKKNPDSAKAFKLRAKANRFLSKWTEAVDDFAACQQIDYDDDIADLHKYCTKRKVWHQKTNQRKEKADAKEKAAAEAAKA